MKTRVRNLDSDYGRKACHAAPCGCSGAGLWCLEMLKLRLGPSGLLLSSLLLISLVLGLEVLGDLQGDLLHGLVLFARKGVLLLGHEMDDPDAKLAEALVPMLGLVICLGILSCPSGRAANGCLDYLPGPARWSLPAWPWSRVSLSWGGHSWTATLRTPPCSCLW